MEAIPKESNFVFLVTFDIGPCVSLSPLNPQCLDQYSTRLHSVILCLIVNMDGKEHMRRTKGGPEMLFLRDSENTHTTDNLYT